MQGADDEVVSLHLIDFEGPLRIMVGLPQLQAQPERLIRGGFFQGVRKLPALLFGDLEKIRAYLHGIGNIEIAVVGKANFRNAAGICRRGHFRHGIVGVEGTGAVNMVIRQIH